MGDLAVTDVDMGCETVPKVQSVINNLSSEAKCDTESVDETSGLSKGSDLANGATDAIDDTLPENDSYVKANSSTENVDNGDALLVSSNSVSDSEMVNEDSSVRGTCSENYVVDRTNEDQTVSSVLQEETDVSNAKDVSPVENVTELNTDICNNSKMNTDESEIKMNAGEDAEQLQCVKDLCENKDDACVEMEITSDEHVGKSFSVKVVPNDNCTEDVPSEKGHVEENKNCDVGVVPSDSFMEDLSSEEDHTKQGKNSGVSKIAPNDSCIEDLPAEESCVKDDKNSSIEVVPNDSSMENLPSEESHVKEDKSSMENLPSEESHINEDESSTVGNLPSEESHIKEDKISGVVQVELDDTCVNDLPAEESCVEEDKNSGVIPNDSSMDNLLSEESHVNEDKSSSVGAVAPGNSCIEDLPSDHVKIGPETKKPLEMGMCETKSESLNNELGNDPQNSKESGTTSDLLVFDDVQFIVLDETGEEDKRTKKLKPPDDSKEKESPEKLVANIKKPKNLAADIAEDAEAIEEEIDSWLACISSGESEKSDDDSEVIDKTLQIICEEEENQKLSDSEEINSALKEMCQEESLKLSDSEAIDSVLKDICIEEQEEQMLSQEVHKAIGDICREENDDDCKLSSTDDGSIKDGIDIESVLETICDDEDEICSRVDSIRKNKSEEEDMDVSDDEDDEEDEISDSEAIVAVVDAISEEDGDNLMSKIKQNARTEVKESTEAISGQMKGSKLSPNKKVTKENVEKEVKSVLCALCNVVSLQLDQVIQSVKIAAMESVLHKTETDKNKEIISNQSNISAINKAVPSEKPKEKQLDCSSGDENKNTINRKRQSDLDEKFDVKKPRLDDKFELEGSGDDMDCDDTSNELNDVVYRQKEGQKQISDENLEESNKVSVEHEVKDKVDEDSCDGENLEALSAEESMDVDSSLETKTKHIDSDDITKDKNDLVARHVETCSNGIKSDAVGTLGDIACLPSPQVLLVAGQIGNENSSDSDRSFCKTLKIEENLENIIKSLSSPKHENSDMEVDSSTTNVEDVLKSEEGSVKEAVAKVEASNTEDVKPKSEPKLEIKKDILIPQGLFNLEEHKPVLKDNVETSETKHKVEASGTKHKVEASETKLKVEASETKFKVETSETKHKVQIKDDVETKANVNHVGDVKPFSGTQLTNGNCSTMEKSSKAEANDENSFLEMAESDLSRFVRGRVREYCERKYSDTIKVLQKQVDKLKQDLEDYRKYSEKVRITMRELATQQSATFRQYGYNPKVEKRTVGVNVRIVQQQQPQQDNKLKTYSNSPKNISTAPQAASPKVATTKSSPVKTAHNAANTSATQPAKTVQGTMPVQLLVTSASLNNSAVSITPAQSTGSRVSTANTNVSLPITTSVVLLTSNPVTTTASHQVVDLTDDNDSSPARRHAAMSNVQLRAATPVRGQLPGKANTPQNLVPLPMMTLPSMVQLLPSGTTVSSAMTEVNTIRMVRPTSGLPQAARLAYFVPNSSGALPVIHQIGGNQPRLAVNVTPQQSAVLPNMRQPLQTFVLTPMRKFQSSLVPVMSTNSQGAIATQARTVTPTTAKMVAATTTTTATLGSGSQLTLTPCFNKHPAPLPPSQMYPPNPKLKALPPKPSLKMNKVATGIVLSWNMSLTSKHADISTYQLYAYQENKGPVGHHLWKKVGDINALPLPMACTLTQFVEGHRYHFTVRAVDVHKRSGPFSEPASILLFNKSQPGESGANKSSR